MSNFNDVVKYNYKLIDDLEVIVVMENGKEALLARPNSTEVIHAHEGPHEFVQGVFNPSLNSLAIKNLEAYLKIEGHGIKSVVWKDGVIAEVKLNVKKGISYTYGDTIRVFTDLDGVSQVMEDHILRDCAGYDNTRHIAKVLSRVENILYHDKVQIDYSRVHTGYLEDILSKSSSLSFWENSLRKGHIKLKPPTSSNSTISYLVKEALKNKSNNENNFLDLITCNKEDGLFQLPLAYSPHKEVQVTNGSYSGLTFQKVANAAVAIWESEDEDGFPNIDSFPFLNSSGGKEAYWKWFKSISLKVKEVV